MGRSPKILVENAINNNHRRGVALISKKQWQTYTQLYVQSVFQKDIFNYEDSRA